jgi:predicted AAA+ superfamily ATPase
MTGKTTLLKELKATEFFDLLDPQMELTYRAKPRLFWEQISALPEGSVIVVDEIQRIPDLLNYVQMGIDQREQVFLLSGSSARKLRRGGANLLGGRALDLKLHPLTCFEIGNHINLNSALQFGTLPKITSLLNDGRDELARAMLGSYVTTYIKEEIQAEALTRNVGAFQRFLSIAVQSNGQIIEFSNISRDCSVPASTVKEYYQILEDTLIGFFLWPFGHSERKKSRPKSYFFDCGVVRALQNRLNDPPTPQENGFLFETWIVNELARIRDYRRKSHEFVFWRELDHEIDILVLDGNKVALAIECKSGFADVKQSTINKFREHFPDARLIVASKTDERKRIARGVEIFPWRETLEIYRAL